jgi:hypothetical protein
MPRWVRIMVWTVVIAVVVVLLFTVVFPRVERMLEDPTMGAPGPGDLAVQAERSPR